MKTFSIQTLGCKVNQYESEQLAVVLRRHGLVQSEPDRADLRVINTCSVTVQAASKSRQSVRRAVRLPVLQNNSINPSDLQIQDHQRVIVTGCWATSDKAAALKIPGVDAVLGHHDDVDAELNRLLGVWAKTSVSPESGGDDGWMKTGEIPTALDGSSSKAIGGDGVKKKMERFLRSSSGAGTTHLPLLDNHQPGHQRGFLKVQDGCDAHCTYCIIPQLRPRLWSKPLADVVDEAKRLVDAGHQELVLTGIFLSAYGQTTALRRRQDGDGPRRLAQLLRAICENVPELSRLRISSLEPGDLTAELISAMQSLRQIVPHFHLPLQSGSDLLLRRMNRQYTRDEFLEMIDRVREAFDRPALTTDIIVGFPGETDEEFAKTLDIVDRARFIHTHAFPFSPRPGTAAARWKKDFIHGPIVNDRINLLRDRAHQHSFEFRQQFLGQTVELLVEQPSSPLSPSPRYSGERAGERGLHHSPETPLDRRDASLIQHGRCSRYFDVHFDSNEILTGQSVRVRIDRVTPTRTHGTLCSPLSPRGADDPPVSLPSASNVLVGAGSPRPGTPE